MITIVPFLNRVNALILNPIITLLFAVSFLYFVYGIVKYLSIDINAKGNEREESRNAILWGIVGMLIMFSVYGLIRFVLATFQVTPTENMYIPIQ